MSPEEFAAMIRQVIADHVYATAPCGCCGTTSIDPDSVEDAVAAAVAQYTATRKD